MSNSSVPLGIVLVLAKGEPLDFLSCMYNQYLSSVYQQLSRDVSVTISHC